MYMGFVKFDEAETTFLQKLQTTHTRLYGKGRQVPLSRVIQGVVRHYREIMEREMVACPSPQNALIGSPNPLGAGNPIT